MSIIITDVEQGTQQWLRMRAGVVSSSEFRRVITPKGEPSSDSNYVEEKAIERITKRPYSTFENYEMRRGRELEPDARRDYEFIHGVEVRQVTFIYLDESRKVGASTDGLVDPNGVYETKAPNGIKHVEYLKKQSMPTEHIPQVQGEIYVAEREWCDFMHYHPGLEPLIVRVYRDDEYIAKLQKYLWRVVYKIDKREEEIRGING